MAFCYTSTSIYNANINCQALELNSQNCRDGSVDPEIAEGKAEW